MTISVVMPVYNAARWVGRAVASALEQRGVGLEVICVDDGSTDGSAGILDGLAAADARVRVVHQENAGQGAARNRGVERATGDYLYFMDADDELAGPDALARLAGEMAREGLDVLLFDAETRADPGLDAAANAVRAQDYVRTGDYAAVRTGRELMARMLKDRAFTVSPCLLLLDRRFVETHALRFPAARIFYEDNVFMTRVMLAAARVAHRPWQLYVRRVHAGSTVT